MSSRTQRTVLATMRGCFRQHGAMQRLNAVTGLRRYSSPAAAANLPLQGYRVLDMTRVLAGVSVRLYAIHSGAKH